jgi:hypothetical protein
VLLNSQHIHGITTLSLRLKKILGALKLHNGFMLASGIPAHTNFLRSISTFNNTKNSARQSVYTSVLVSSNSFASVNGTNTCILSTDKCTNCSNRRCCFWKSATNKRSSLLASSESTNFCCASMSRCWESRCCRCAKVNPLTICLLFYFARSFCLLY